MISFLKARSGPSAPQTIFTLNRLGLAPRRRGFDDLDFDFEAGLCRWLVLIERGELSPDACFKGPASFVSSPLQFWGRALLERRRVDSPPDETLSPSESLFLAALARMLSFGLSLDSALRSSDPNRPTRPDGPFPPVPLPFDYRPPLLHMAIGADAEPGLPVEFIRGLLLAGADPRIVNEHGTPGLAHCCLTPSRERAIAVWELLIQHGARAEDSIFIGSPENGWTQFQAERLGLGPASSIADLARLQTLHPGFLAELDARAQFRELSLAAGRPRRPASRKAFL